MSNKKAKLVKGTYITGAMFDLMNPFYNFNISDPKNKNRVDMGGYEPSIKSFKNLDIIPRIGDIVMLCRIRPLVPRCNKLIKIKQVGIYNNKFRVTGDSKGQADWFDLEEVYPIKLNANILNDLGFEIYGKDHCNSYKYRFILKGFINLKLTLESYDGNLDPRVWISEGKPLIHYLHELQDILRISGRDKVISNSCYSHTVKVLTKSEYPLYLLPENNNRSACWYTNK